MILKVAKFKFLPYFEELLTSNTMVLVHILSGIGGGEDGGLEVGSSGIAQRMIMYKQKHTQGLHKFSTIF